ncbi:MAG: SDR family oxidoreductase [Alphaproteobacteria bacterium]|nr:SDR family oxidoreductase [Alphaproteobacteria bacterium]
MSSYLEKLFNLNGKVAVVIGGGGHLCGEMARAYAASGMKVAVMDMRLEKAEKVCTEIIDNGGQAVAFELEATNKESHEAALQFVIETYGQVDVLVNGAGFNAPTPVMEIPKQEYLDIIDSHFGSTLLGCQVFGKHMLERGSGSIINMSSASANPPLSKAFSYSAAKAAVLNITKNLAREWGTQGVRVNALRPGFFPTEWSQKHFIDEAREKAIHGHTPMARYGTPDELSGAVLWLASDAAGFVTGAEIEVDGGFSCMTI